MISLVGRVSVSVRPVFIPQTEGRDYVEKIDIKFTWYPGFSKEQKRKSIKSLHERIRQKTNSIRILEISTKSEERTGIKASAFNLKLVLDEVSATLESIYQGSKVFESGGPYKDLYQKNSLESKRDPRLKSSGNLEGFEFSGEFWGVNENFYDWLYLNALDQNKEVRKNILDYDAFTDIEFNPKKSYNCQAFSAALFSSISQRGQDLKEIKNKTKFKKMFSDDGGISGGDDEIPKFKQVELF